MKQSTVRKALLINLCAIAAVPLILLFIVPVHDKSIVPRMTLYAAIYASSIGLPSALILPRIVGPTLRRCWPAIPVITVSISVLTALGCLLAGLILVAFKMQEPANYWREFFGVVRFTTAIAIFFGLSAYLYENLRGKLEETRSKLQQKELDEERARKLAAEARLSSLESRIHPHFLFNTLNSISSLIPVNPARAEEIVGRLAALLRSSLDTSGRNLIPLGKELELVHDYLEIEKARFGDRLTYSIEVPPALQALEVPPMGIQSIAENAVKHGIATQKSGGNIRILASTEGGALRIEVIDSGPGFELSALQSGHGLENLIGRLEMLFGSEARVEVARRGGECVVSMVVPQHQPA